MSKTYRRYPSFSDYSRKHTRWAKRQASKTVRRNWNIDDGKQYRKVYETWNIRDYRFTCYTDQEAREWFGEDEIHRIGKKSLSPFANRSYETIRKGDLVGNALESIPSLL